MDSVMMSVNFLAPWDKINSANCDADSQKQERQLTGRANMRANKRRSVVMPKRR